MFEDDNESGDVDMTGWCISADFEDLELI